MEFKIGYGKANLTFKIDDDNLAQVIEKSPFTSVLSDANEIRRAIENPIGTEKLEKIVKLGEKIAIITGDITRPVPSKLILPVIIEKLREAGVRDEDVTIIFGLGSHRRQTDAERKYIVGDEIFASFKCIDSDPDNCVRLGKTSRGTPVDITTAVAEADRRICIGNIEYHYFAGYSGGIKAIMPGTSSREAIQNNHSGMIKANASAGVIDNNPVRMDIEETGIFISVDFIVNVILDEDKKVAGAFAGHHIKAHRAGCALLDRLYKIHINEKADIVITTPGGYPKDINLYQAQKALDNAKSAVRNGGIIIFAAACTEGMGEKVFERWYSECESPDSLIDRIHMKFELGGHKAAAIAMVLKKARIFLVSEMNPDLVRSLFMEPFQDIRTAISNALEICGAGSRVIVMPHGASTLPVMTD